MGNSKCSSNQVSRTHSPNHLWLRSKGSWKPLECHIEQWRGSMTMVLVSPPCFLQSTLVRLIPGRSLAGKTDIKCRCVSRELHWVSRQVKMRQKVEHLSDTKRSPLFFFPAYSIPPSPFSFVSVVHEYLCLLLSLTSQCPIFLLPTGVFSLTSFQNQAIFLPRDGVGCTCSWQAGFQV